MTEQPAQLNASEKEDAKPPRTDSPAADPKFTSPPLSEHDSASDHAEKEVPQDGGALRAVDSNAEPNFPSFRKTLVIMIAIYLSFFLVALVFAPSQVR